MNVQRNGKGSYTITDDAGVMWRVVHRTDIWLHPNTWYAFGPNGQEKSAATLREVKALLS